MEGGQLPAKLVALTNHDGDSFRAILSLAALMLTLRRKKQLDRSIDL